ncbi:MAG TPA: Hsp20/alpha crystallin family protein [Candidatus Nanoarchaeia archaeon]|nr:Hsp20/alpha crystallin family protein [Candidatus Nanoarchaeia archaeon]
MWDPMDALERMQREMDRLVSRVYSGGRDILDFKGREGKTLERYRTPAADIRETERSIIADIELPGVDKRDISLNVTEDSIEVGAQKSREEEKKGRYTYESAKFYRRLPLPAKADAEDVDASFKNGVLRVIVKKSIPEKRKRVDIK